MNLLKNINELEGVKVLNDSELSLIAMLLPHHLRRVQGHTLKLIKRELKDFNATSYTWKDKKC